MFGRNRKEKRALKATGARTSQLIQQQYLQRCANAGELQYKIAEMSKQLEELNAEIRALNQEYTDLPADKKNLPTAPTETGAEVVSKN